MTPELLMPDTAEARASGLMDDHASWRIWWAVNVLGLKVTKRRTGRVTPDPGAVDLADEELG